MNTHGNHHGHHNALQGRAGSPIKASFNQTAAGIQQSKPRPSNFMSTGGGLVGANQTTGNPYVQPPINLGSTQTKHMKATVHQNNSSTLVTLHLNQPPHHNAQSQMNVTMPLQQAVASQQSKNTSSTSLTTTLHNTIGKGNGTVAGNSTSKSTNQPHLGQGTQSNSNMQEPLNMRSTLSKAGSRQNTSSIIMSEGRNSTPNYSGAGSGPPLISQDIDFTHSTTQQKLGSQKHSIQSQTNGMKKQLARHTPINGKGMSSISATLDDRRVQFNQSANEAKNKIEISDSQRLQQIVTSAQRFKQFFEYLLAPNGSVLSSGGEYYFHESATSQVNFDQISMYHQRPDFVSEEEEIRSTLCDMENQRVVRADAERTRGGEQLDKDLVELVLTKYCKNNSIKYKQGLNEIVAPFMYMMQESLKLKEASKGGNEKSSSKFDLRFVYNSFSCFVRTYLTNFYEEDEFYSLQTALALLQLLHKYHDPQVALLLINSQVTPEMYAVPWFLTYFSNKFDLPIVIEFWELIVTEDNVLNIFFFAIALLLHNRQQILESDNSHLPQVMSKLVVSSSSELKTVWKLAQTVRQNTPFSFGELPDVKRLFILQPKDQQNLSDNEPQKSLGNEYDECDDFSNKSGNPPINRQEKMMQAIERIESIPCLPVLPEEIFFYAYPEMINCSNPSCCNSLSSFKLRDSFNQTSGIQTPSQNGNQQAISIASSANRYNDQQQIKRRSQAFEVQELLSPVRGSISGGIDDLSKAEIELTRAPGTQLQINTQNSSNLAAGSNHRRVTGSDAYYQSMIKNSNKANIHDIIKREINSKQQQQSMMFNGRLMSNQPSPIKGLSEQYENYRGIDLSSQRSPFKQINKQLQAQADAMPLETESNVNDDAQEQQESHIDLINETARMKHLAMNQELRNQMNHMIESGLIMPGIESQQFINSPKINMYNVIGGKNTADTQLIQFTPGHHPRGLNQQQYQQNNIYYEKGGGASRQAMKGVAGNSNNISSQASNYSGQSSKRGSITAYAFAQQLPQIQMHPLTQSIPEQKLEMCGKCIKKLTYEQKQQLLNASPEIKRNQGRQTPGLNDTSLVEEESHDFYYEKIRFLIVDCRLDSLQKEAILPNSFQLQISAECTKEYLQGLTEKLLSCKDIYHICLLGLDPITEKIVNKFETNLQNQSGEDILDIGSFHESILRFFIEDLQKKGFKHISMVPGGFQECHEIAMRYNFSLVHHDSKTCYHCEKSRGENRNSQSDLYNKQFSIVGLNDILSGFKHWYDFANNKLKNLVKGANKGGPSNHPQLLTDNSLQDQATLKIIPNQPPSQQPQLQQNPLNFTHTGGLQFTQRHSQMYNHQQKLVSTFDNTSGGTSSYKDGTNFLGIPAKLANQTQGESSSQISTPAESLYQSMGSQQNVKSTGAHESRNQGPHNQTHQKNLIKTTDNLNQKTQANINVSNTIGMNRGSGVPGNEAYFNMIQYKQPDSIVGERPQDLINVGSGGGGGGLPLSFISQSSRQDIHNRFQSGACSSNASVNSSQNDGGNNLRDAISNKKIMSYKLMSKVPGDRSQEGDPPSNQNQIIILQGSKASSIKETPMVIPNELANQQDLINPLELQNFEQKGVAFQPIQGAGSNLSDLALSSMISLQISHSSLSGVQTNELADTQQFNDIKVLLSPTSTTSKPQLPQQKNEEEKKVGGDPQSDEKQRKTVESTSNPFNSEDDQYYMNGLIKQVEVTYPELEAVMTKKSNIVYRAMKLQLKKKPEQVALAGSSSAQSSSSTTSQPSIAYPVYLIITQFTVSVVREIARRKSNLAAGGAESSMSQLEEWDQNDFEELHQFQANNEKKAFTPGKQMHSVALIESRYLMYDLIKITSRKSSSKIITFYFRIPLLEEYSAQILEQNLVTQLDQRPTIKYQFAFKRKNYKEVSASFEFTKEDDAKQCIANVSSLYKKLKNSKN